MDDAAAGRPVGADGRYAPSPTGSLHLGNLRTALLAWLLARSQGARFLLRIEDLDTTRSRERFVAEQLDDLRALGLDWDGEPVRQSERAALYAEAIERLADAGHLYECFCTRAEIREAASAPHDDRPEGAYPGTCRELSSAERDRRLAAGREPALRVRAEGARIEFEDRFAGRRSGVVDDFVVRRNDGIHAYNLAVVVDDAEQGIGEVVRGTDLLDSTARQIWLGHRLGLPAIRSWAHVPLVLGEDGKRMAKRHGAATLAGRRDAGQSAEDVRALLAASVGLCEQHERPSIAELLARFDPANVPAANAPLE
jgi:glutamyl-tRNA synthetase